MRIICVSDNHGNTYYMEELLSIYQEEADEWIHCGDSELLETHPLWQNYRTVKGNMDIAEGFKSERVEELEGDRFLIVHGHRHGVKRSYDELKTRALEENCQFAFYGHTHIPKVEEEDGIFFINPGSIAQPRDREIGTYLIMDLDKDNHQVSFTYYDRDHNEVKELTKSFNLTD